MVSLSTWPLVSNHDSAEASQPFPYITSSLDLQPIPKQYAVIRSSGQTVKLLVSKWFEDFQSSVMFFSHSDSLKDDLKASYSTVDCTDGGWVLSWAVSFHLPFFFFFCNIATLVLGATRENGYQDGLGVVLSGRNKVTSGWTSTIHVAINVLSILLLSASNYTM